MLWLYENKWVSNPKGDERGRVLAIDDTPDVWPELLDDPRPIPDDDGERDKAPLFCGARYFEHSTTRVKENIDAVECLVLDVDSTNTPTGEVPSEEALREALEGLRAVVYTSPSHTREAPRWRVLLPLLTPLPPKKHRSLVDWLSQNLVAGYEGCIDVPSTGDPSRLGFVGVTKHPESYRWWSQPGQRFDWTGIPLEDEAWVDAPLGGLERSSLWSDRTSALRAALKRYATTGQGVGRGQGRTMILWDTALALWWAWAAEDEDFVMTVLRHVNTNFAEPEDEDELVRKMTEAHTRAIGERRVPQVNGTYGSMREPVNVVSREAIISHAKRLRHRRHAEDNARGEALRRMARGETLSDEPETWPGLATKCARELARAFPSETPERLASFYRPSFAAMKAAGSATVPSVEAVASYITAALEGLRKQKEEMYEKADAKMREQIEYVTHGERSTKYTKQEVEHWRESVGLRDNNWILVSGQALFVFRNGTWVGPYTRDEFEAQGYKDLAAAADVGVRTQTFNEAKQEWSNIPISKLLHLYGSTCKTRIDLHCEKSWFNEDEHVLVLAGPPKRELEPKFHVEVDQWFRVMTGRETPTSLRARQHDAATWGERDNYDAICNWLASVVQLDHPCSALYLQGKKSVGKGLFADGVARIWRTGAIPLEDAFHEFNSLLSETPFIWVDEGLPEHVRASVLLRKALAARELTYKRKFRDSGKIIGCLRMLFTANNLDLFNAAKEIVKKDDVEALGLRFVHVYVRPEAADYLESIHPRHHDFVERNMLAEHALWLHDKRWAAIKSRGHRFLVKGNNTNVSDVVATNSEVTSECVNAICEALVESRKSDWMRVFEGEIYVNAVALRKYLAIQVPAARAWNDRDVTRAITSIASGPNRVIRHGKLMKMRPVNQTSIRAWCENTNVFDWVDVEEGINKAKSAPELPATPGTVHPIKV